MRTRYLVVLLAAAFVGVLIASTRANSEEDPVRRAMLARLFNLDRTEQRQEFYRQIFRFDPPAVSMPGMPATPNEPADNAEPASSQAQPAGEPEANDDQDAEPRVAPSPRTSPRWRINGADLLRETSDVLAFATYKTVFELNGREPGLGDVSGTVTIARGEDARHLGVSGNLGGAEGSFIAIQRPDANFLCIKGQGDSACLKTGSNAASPLPLPSVLELQPLVEGLANQPDSIVRELEPQQVAGRDARCFEVGAQPGRGTLCVDVELPMVVLVEGHFRGAEFEMRLKEYEPVPGPEDFEPPFPVAELP